jgi:hypothetical protein
VNVKAFTIWVWRPVPAIGACQAVIVGAAEEGLEDVAADEALDVGMAGEHVFEGIRLAFEPEAFEELDAAQPAGHPGQAADRHGVCNVMYEATGI